MNTIQRLPLAALLPFALLGCDVFDESLIEAPPPVTPEGKAELLVGDELNGSVPLNLSYAPTYHDPIDMNYYTDDMGTLPVCLDEADSPGADLFFKVSMKQGEKWHFHVQGNSTPFASDPALYILNDEFDPVRACSSPLQGINACGPGFAEHFSFLPDQTKEYFVGVDEMTGTNESIKIFAAIAECGNGFKEHSEYCDPTGVGDTGPTADCEDCRKLLPDGGDDLDNSVNDGPFDATKLAISTSDEFDFTVVGAINNLCDFDFFSFDLESSARVTATLIVEDEFNCAGIDLRFWDQSMNSNPFEFDEGEASECMVKTANLVGADRHWVRVFGKPSLAGKTPYRYKLKLDFEPR
jgi:hypothetical protein